ncbi:MAG: hypothetical protein CVV02_02975 [Firmicutes bacterium HGW-Firmicutes-7]|nr:MAG: hypothetical protein CVV02_02975 [Firmicutes bacterium HGW-Firmicutes-7]
MRIDLQVDCNKKEILENIQCYENLPNYQIYTALYDELLYENAEILIPIGYYVLTPQLEEVAEANIEMSVCCIVTLGKAVDVKIHSYFEASDYLKGVLLNGIVDFILFSASNQLYHHVFDEVKSQGMMMTKRKEPGTCNIPVTAQKWILDTVNAVERTDITITSGYMLNPTKSIGYFYGASKSIAYTPFDHDCSQCDHIHCPQRKIYVTVKTDEKELVLQVKSGSNLLDILRESKLPVQADCSGKQICGKCKVKILSKNLLPSENEKLILSNTEIADGIVLACFQQVNTNIVIEIKHLEATILSDFHFPNIKRKKYKSKIIKGLLKYSKNNKSSTDLIHKLFGKKYTYTLSALRKLSSILPNEPLIALIKDEKEIVHIEKENIKNLFTIGIDIGTTTIVIALVDLIEEKVVSMYKCINPQKTYGADIISRIQYVGDHQDKVLTNVMIEALLKGITHLMDTHQLISGQILEIAISGNTTMLYLLTGIDPKSLASSPFSTTHMGLINISFSELFADMRLSCPIILMPGLSAYIGADILSGLYFSGITEMEGNYLFIDIGTNGELAIKVNNRIICVATAAGPAFEGTNITFGMGSLEGAICGVTSQNNGDWLLEVIGNSTPKGICGSGLIDVMAHCLNQGLVDETGRIQEGQIIPILPSNGSIYLSQQDIRELQLAKAAIAAGIEVLLQESGCNIENLDCLLLAGGFGHHLNIKNAIRIGLLPGGLENKTKVIGNSSLGGTVRYLLEKNSQSTLSDINQKCEYLELSNHIQFYDCFVNHINF